MLKPHISPNLREKIIMSSGNKMFKPEGNDNTNLRVES
jgi:hypothetical protein